MSLIGFELATNCRLSMLSLSSLSLLYIGRNSIDCASVKQICLGLIGNYSLTELKLRNGLKHTREQHYKDRGCEAHRDNAEEQLQSA